MPNTSRLIDGEAVRRIRIAMGLQANNVARTTGISPSSLSNIESGRRHPREVVILGLARSLGVHPDRISTVIVHDEARSA